MCKQVYEQNIKRLIQTNALFRLSTYATSDGTTHYITNELVGGLLVFLRSSEQYLSYKGNQVWHMDGCTNERFDC
jgi:hypothetical protein